MLVLIGVSIRCLTAVEFLLPISRKADSPTDRESVYRFTALIKSLRIILITITLSLFWGCSSGPTWRWVPFRGPTRGEVIAHLESPSSQFTILCRQFLTHGYKISNFSPELLIADLRYDFAGTETWSGAKAVMSDYCEPMAAGLLTNPYGKRAWAEIQLSVQPATQAGLHSVQYHVTIKAWGEDGGFGGAGPYPMNSKGKLEEILRRQIELFLNQINQQVAPEAPSSVGRKLHL